MSRSLKSFLPATMSLRRVTTAGRAATGSFCRGFSAVVHLPTWIAIAARFRPWVAGRCSTTCGEPCPHRRRSSSLMIGWTLPLEAAAVWTMFILATIALPTLIPVVSAIVPARSGVVVRSHIVALGAELRLAFAQSGLLIILLAHQAWSMIDAIGRTLVRLFITRRHLLEWTTAAQAAIGQRLDLAGFYRRMVAAVILAGVVLLVSLFAGEGTWPLVLPFAALWAASPAFARWISQSPPVAGRVTMIRPRCHGASTDGAPDVAILRNLHHACRQHAAAGQFSGRSSGSCPSNIAHQYRALSPVRGERPRFRLDRHPRGR